MILVLLYNEEKMLYPARWKKITVDQSKVLKNLLFHFFGATRYYILIMNDDSQPLEDDLILL